MIAKQRLLAGLHELIYVEEGFMPILANFTKALIETAEGIDDAKKKEMVKLLSVLHRDSSGHKEKIDRLIAKIEADPRNEY